VENAIVPLTYQVRTGSSELWRAPFPILWNSLHEAFAPWYPSYGA
jgi:hypothetical protein